MKKINPWQITTVIMAALFVLSLFNVFSFDSSASQVTGNAVGYINDNLLSSDGLEATLIDSQKVNGVYEATLNIAGQVSNVYISPDGKLLFPTAIPLEDTIDSSDDSSNTQPEVIEVDAADGAFIGPENAENVVIVFSDFECPFCGLAFDDEAGKARFGADYESAVPILEEMANNGEIKLVFRHFPLSFHEYAMPAALASECANEQGMFWEYHDILFMNQNALTTEDLKGYAVELGLETEQFNECLDSAKYEDKINQDIQDGISYGVSGTPAFFVNGQLLSGALPFSEFEPLLNL